MPHVLLKICGTKDITVKEENIETGAELITALRACANKMDEDEVPMESRILFITPTLASLADDMDTTKSREVLKRFSQIHTSSTVTYVHINNPS